ncbi:MAG TPA: hypothetical protein VFV38_14745 [Ktedonobacteraceae bacterium]|nr:hypothetical protein [Ktedonobacteraceae bacterium]
MYEQPHLPDFATPDFTQPALEQADLATPGFRLPDPATPDPPDVIQLSLWPANLDRSAPEQPDPLLPDLAQAASSARLLVPDSEAHLVPEPRYEPEVVMAQRPGELDPSALVMLRDSPDRAQQPTGLAAPDLFTSQDGMSRRNRHLGMLELGLEREGGGR